MKLTVMGVQAGPYEGTLDGQLAMIDRLCQEGAQGHDVDVIVLPELFNTPYFPIVENDQWFASAEQVPGKTTDFMAALALRHGSYVVGSLFTDRDGGHYNSAPVVAPDGSILGVYDKTHIPRVDSGNVRGFEDYYFEPGMSLPVWDLAGVRSGLLICFDRSFPESWRVLTLDGAQVVFVVASSSGFRSKNFTRELQVRAAENAVWVVAVNKAGDELSADAEMPTSFYGSSCVIAPDGEVRHDLKGVPGTSFVFEIDTDEVASERTKLPLLRTRRPDLYGPLVEP